MHHDSSMPTMAQLCLGAFAAVGAAVVAVAIGMLALGRWRPAMQLGAGGVFAGSTRPRPKIRAGPDLLLQHVVALRLAEVQLHRVVV